MTWEIEFLKTLGQMGNQNSSLDWLSRIMQIITFSMDLGALAILTIILFLFFKKTRQCAGCLIFANVIFTILLANVILKLSIRRTRPFNMTEGLILQDYLLGKTGHPQWFLAKGTSVFLKVGEIPSDFSFPSGHSFISFITATIIFIYFKKAGVFALLYACLVAFSRLYFGVHYPTDVIAGSLLGIGCGILSYFIYKKLRIPMLNWFEKIKTKHKEKGAHN